MALAVFKMRSSLPMMPHGPLAVYKIPGLFCIIFMRLYIVVASDGEQMQVKKTKYISN